MQRISHLRTPVKAGLMLALLLLGAGLIGTLWPKQHGSETTLRAEPETTTYTPESGTTFMYPVSGIVESVSQTVMRAQTAGTVVALPHREGSLVRAGDVLYRQDVPVLASRLALQDATNGLTSLAQEASSIARIGEQEVAAAQDTAASTTAELMRDASMFSRENSALLLVSGMYGALAQLTATLDFIDTNAGYFSTLSRERFRQTVEALYGAQPSYLVGPVIYPVRSHEDIMETLRTVTEGTTYPDSTSLISLAEILDAELDATRTVLEDGEKDFFDERTITTTDPLYTAYLTQRATLVEAQAALRSALAAARMADRTTALDVQGAATQATLASLGHATARAAAQNAIATQAQTGVVGDAALGVLYAEQSLGAPRASFAGTVSDVYVEEGEYVTPGAPVLTLVGVGAHEVEVTLPGSMLPYLATGTPFVVDGMIVGYVDRFAPVLVQGRITASITLTELYTPGSILRGSLVFTTVGATSFLVPRTHLFFDTHGPYIQTVSRTVTRVHIVHDDGTMLVVDAEVPVLDALLPATGKKF